MLRHAVPPHRLAEHVSYDAPCEEAFDAVVLDGTNAIVFEIKGSFARAEAKYSGQLLPFFRGVSEKFGNQPHCAVRQLATNVRNTFGLPRRREVSTLPVRELRCVWPVVVFLEPILGFGLASGLLVDRFIHRIRNLLLQEYTSVRPVVFLDIEDIETIVQNIREGDFTFVDCLREKLSHDEANFYSFHDFYWGQFVPEHRIEFKRNTIIANEYRELSETAMARFGAGVYHKWVPLRDRCSFGLFPWLISQALSVTYMAVERRLYLERNCRLPESPAHSRRRNREGPASSQGLNSQRGFGPAVEPRRKSRPRSTSLHGSSPCKCQRLSTLRWDRLPPSRPSTKSGARAGGRRLSDRRLHRWLAGTSASAPSSHGAADLLGLNRAHICVRNPQVYPD